MKKARIFSAPFPFLQWRPNKQFPANAITIESFLLLQSVATESIPRLTQGSGRSSGVEHNLAKVRVGRSNRLARSKKQKARTSVRAFCFSYTNFLKRKPTCQFILPLHSRSKINGCHLTVSHNLTPLNEQITNGRGPCQ